MSSPIRQTLRILTMMALGLVAMAALQSSGRAGPWMAMLVDTGLFDTGSSDATDDTASPPEDSGGSGGEDTGSSGGSDTGESGGGETGSPSDDTGSPSDDTSSPSDDTGSPSDDTGGDDTGDTDPADGSEDTGAGGLSAAELAGEKGGCGCASTSGSGTTYFWIAGVLICWRRRSSTLSF